MSNKTTTLYNVIALLSSSEVEGS